LVARARAGAEADQDAFGVPVVGVEVKGGVGLGIEYETFFS
jgi:hypothetical protein